MRQQNFGAAYALLLLLYVSAIFAGEPKNNDDFANPGYDEVVRDLIVSLSKDKTTSQDAAMKLARLGKRSVAPLTEIFNASYVEDPEKTPNKKGDTQLAWYSAWSLSRIKLADAARPLIPLLTNEKAPADLRQIAIEAQGMELLEEGGVALQKLAQSDPDINLRKKALGQLSIMPNFWAKSEKLFLDSLADPDDEIRMLAAKQCMFARIYFNSIEKLIELVEKDPYPPVRTNAMLALQRMNPLQKVRTGRVVPVLVRVCNDSETPPVVLQQGLRTLNIITGVTLKDNNGVQTWWKKYGEAEYGKIDAALKDASKDAPTPNAPPPANTNPAP